MTKKELTAFKKRVAKELKEAEERWAKLTPEEKEEKIKIATRFERKVRSSFGLKDSK